MEIEEVAAHNANVYKYRSAEKRKREKAQDQLRSRMRKRNNGPTTSAVSTRSFRSSQQDKGESTLMPGVKPIWDDAKHNSSEEWRSQEACYSTLAHPYRADRDKRQGEIPLTELVGRVMERRGHTTSQSSPMTIRALRPSAPPYAIQHRGLIRKIQPINKRKPTSGGPYVVVLNRSSSTKTSGLTESQEPRVLDLPPLKQHHNSADVEIATWRPELTTKHEPYIHPNAEDRSVTNYRLQMQQAIKIAELRCDFSTSSKPMHKHAPLPAIQVAYEVSDTPKVGNCAVVAEKKTAVDPHESKLRSLPHQMLEKTNRFTSSQEVLHSMQVRKQAKRRKANGNDFNNPLRTRNRFTVRTKVFKEDLQKARELSIIREDQSSISDRLSKLSAGRTSAASFRSVGSLKRIEESEIPSITNKQLSGASKTGSEKQSPASPSTVYSAGEHPDKNVSSESTSTPADSNPLSQSDGMSPLLNSNDSADIIASSLVEPTSEGLRNAQESLTNTGPDAPCKTSEVPPPPKQNILSEVGNSTSFPSQSGTKCIVNNSATNSRQSVNSVTSEDSRHSHASNISDTFSSSENGVVKTKLAMNKTPDASYVEKADSHHQDIAANTFDMRDVILPAETVQ